jgi:hypothetical protein
MCVLQSGTQVLENNLNVMTRNNATSAETAERIHTAETKFSGLVIPNSGHLSRI